MNDSTEETKKDKKRPKKIKKIQKSKIQYDPETQKKREETLRLNQKRKEEQYKQVEEYCIQYNICRINFKSNFT